LELVEQPLHLVGLVPLLRVGRHTLRLGDIVPRRSQEHLPHPRTNALAGICSEYL
jgi:hypothetical protein